MTTKEAAIKRDGILIGALFAIVVSVALWGQHSLSRHLDAIHPESLRRHEANSARLEQLETRVQALENRG